ncbi:MAG: hypothetical protein RBS01_04005 [Candidatus Dojkabacteria bacterium]|jgi:hypothetical protein|nr:hypothetical protein [Candidatus Dojkabacteria bacterium]
MKKETITGQIYNNIFELLDKNPSGLHWSELISQIQKSNPTLHPKTINGCIWKLIEKYPNKVYKPEKGLFQLLKYKK